MSSRLTRFFLKYFARPSARNAGGPETLDSQTARSAVGQGSNVVIRTYQADHGGTVFIQALTERQRRTRTRFMAIAVIAAMAVSAATVMGFNDRTAAMARADVTKTWTP